MMISCYQCDSSGWLVLRTCKLCNNRPDRRACRRCGGSGHEKVYVTECPHCDGVGRVEERKGEETSK